MKVIETEKIVKIPEGVQVQVKSRKVQVTGPRGELIKSFTHIPLEITLQNQRLVLRIWHGKKKHLACIRTVASLIQNMINGVTKGFEYKMRFVYAHFPINANVTGKAIEIRNFLGDKNTRRIEMLDGVTVEMSTAQKDEIILSGNDVQNVSQSGI
jgi:large subunit ribosomal protein L9e